MNQPDELDRLLDEALASYSLREPSLGYERRVLRRVQMASRTPRNDWWRWTIAVPALAAILLLAVTHRTATQPPVAAPPIAVAAKLPATTLLPSGAQASPPRVHQVAYRVKSVPSRLPKREVFGLPAPLSREERALLEMATRFPAQAREILIDDVERRNQPIQIPKIEITPLSNTLEQ